MSIRLNKSQLICSSLLAVSLLTLSGAPASAFTASTLTFSKSTDTKMIYDNNPEILWTSDLADSTIANKLILQSRGVSGKVRTHWEHKNDTGSTITYATQIHNPNSTTLNIQVHGYGFSSNTSQFNGGIPFADLYNQAGTRAFTLTLGPGETSWLVRQSGIPTATFFSGAVEFTIPTGYNVIVNNLAYVDATKVNGTATYEGWINSSSGTRSDAHRQYKGITSTGNVNASNLNFSFGNSDAGTMKSWTDHISKMNANGIHTDMVSFNMPYTNFSGSYLVDPNAYFSADTVNPNQYPNLANWGVKYTYSGTLTNTGTTTRYVDFVVGRQTDAGIAFAYKPNGTNTWSQDRLSTTLGTTSKTISTITVGAGQSVPYNVQYILGSPAGGGQANYINLR